jgi:hypothetical protein
MRGASVKCFGVGDGFPCADRHHAAFLYRLERASILIDCGEPLDSSYRASGLSYDLVDGLVLSHLHPDHAGGFFMLMQAFRLQGRRKDLPIYLPAGAARPLRGMLAAMSIVEKRLPFRTRWHTLESGKPISIAGVWVTPFLTTHMGKPSRRRSTQAPTASFCFLLEDGKHRVGHSSDLGRPEDLAPLLTAPLDLLVCELAHFSPTAIFSYLQGRAIGRVVFVHIAGRLWSDLGPTRRLAKRMLSNIPHIFARDLQEIRL